MVAGVIVTHGHLAEALLESAQLIVGEIPLARAVSLEASDGADLCDTKVREAVAQLDQGDGVLVLTDLLGGTPCNVGLACAASGAVEVVTGVNLSMVVKLRSIQAAGLGLNEAAHEIASYGTRSVRIPSEDLRRSLKGENA